MSVTISHPTNRPNFTRVGIGSLWLYFSYSTIVAFSDQSPVGLVVSKNYWGTTTGKHLNWISDDHGIRVDRDEFAAKLRGVLEARGLE